MHVILPNGDSRYYFVYDSFLASISMYGMWSRLKFFTGRCYSLHHCVEIGKAVGDAAAQLAPRVNDLELGRDCVMGHFLAPCPPTTLESLGYSSSDIKVKGLIHICP